MTQPSKQRIGLWLVGARGGVAVSTIAGLIAHRLGLADGTGLVSQLSQFAHLPLPAWEHYYPAHAQFYKDLIVPVRTA